MVRGNQMKAVLFLTALLLVGCTDTYRYPCQDPANANKEECNRPICEADGMCYDTLNGLPPKQQEEAPAVVEETTVAAPCNNETTGE